MDFEFVLAELIARVGGAVGVLLLDHDGEAVEVFGSEGGSLHDIKVLGAYQGLFLASARAACSHHDLGECRELTVRMTRETLLTRTLPDGYYLTLVLGESAAEGRARIELRRAAERIRGILF